MIVSYGLGCASCGGSCMDSIEEGLAGILEGLGDCPSGYVQNGDVCNQLTSNNTVDPNSGVSTAYLAQEAAALAANPAAAAILASSASSAPTVAVYQPTAAQIAVATAPPPVVVPPSGLVSTAVPSVQTTVSQTQQQAQTSTTGTSTGLVSTTPINPTGSTTDNPVLDWLGLSNTPMDLIEGIPNWLLLIGGIGAWAFLGRKG